MSLRQPRKLVYSRDALLAVKPTVAGRPSTLKEDCPVLAGLLQRAAVAVPVVRHAKKAQSTVAPGDAAVSSKERLELAELRRHFQVRAASAAAAHGTSESPQRMAAAAAASTSQAAATATPGSSPAKGAAPAPPVAGAAAATANAPKEGKKATPAASKQTDTAVPVVAAAAAAASVAKPRKGWATTSTAATSASGAASAAPAEIPTAPITRAAARRAADSRRAVREPPPLPGDPAAQLPSAVTALQWSLTSLSPEYYVVPVPVLVDERGDLVTPADVANSSVATTAAATGGGGGATSSAAGLNTAAAPFVLRGGVVNGGAGTASAKSRPKELSAAEMAQRVRQRERQIRLGQRTLGYKVWERFRQRGLKCPVDASTPPPVQACSKRSWDGQVRRWRQLLHEYDALALQVFTPEEVAELQRSYQAAEREEAAAVAAEGGSAP